MLIENSMPDVHNARLDNNHNNLDQSFNSQPKTNSKLLNLLLMRVEPTKFLTNANWKTTKSAARTLIMTMLVAMPLTISTTSSRMKQLILAMNSSRVSMHARILMTAFATQMDYSMTISNRTGSLFMSP
jgi:hypothetical protein